MHYNFFLTGKALLAHQQNDSSVSAQPAAQAASMANTQARKEERSMQSSSSLDTQTSEPLSMETSRSSVSSGFFQDPPKVLNQAQDDVSFRRAFKLFLPSQIQTQLNGPFNQFGQLVLSPRVLRWGAIADSNPPTIQSHDSFGHPKNDLITSEGWRELQDLGIREGTVALGYEGTYGELDRLVQFLKYYIWAPSSGLVTCPSAMQDGAAALIRRYLYGIKEEDRNWMSEEVQGVLESAYLRLTSRDTSLAWTSGQWMTERPGGSDVRNTETRATLSPDSSSAITEQSSDGNALGPWRIDGFKWFSSATDANMTVLLAKTGASDDVSLFFAPTRKRSKLGDLATTETTFNGITLHRLKSKLGTRQLPTAELELRDLRAYMLGRPGQGTKEISTVLNITRVHNAVSAVSGWGRALGVSRAWARVRKSSGRLLCDIPLHVKGMAEETVRHRAFTLFSFFVVALLGKSESASISVPNTATNTHDETDNNNPLLPATNDTKTTAHLLRLLTPVLKASTALAGIAGIRFAMESLGGVGYLENSEPELNLARAFRDANVLSIWEGTTDVMASDVVRVVKGRSGHEVMAAFSQWVSSQATRWDSPSNNNNNNTNNTNNLKKENKETVKRATSLLDSHMAHLRSLVATTPADELTYHARELLRVIPIVVGTVMLVVDAMSDGDVLCWKIAERWVALHAAAGESSSNKGRVGARGDRMGSEAHEAWREEAKWDRAIVFGVDEKRSRL